MKFNVNLFKVSIRLHDWSNLEKYRQMGKQNMVYIHKCFATTLCTGLSASVLKGLLYKSMFSLGFKYNKA